MKEQNSNSFSFPFSFSYMIYPLSKKYSPNTIIDLIRTVNIENEKIVLQVLDPKFIVSKRQLEIAIYQTIAAFRSKENIARDKGTELLLRLSGHRQIKKALKIFGLEEQSEYLLLVCFGDSEDVINEKLVEISNEIGFNNKELISQLPISNSEVLKDFYNHGNDIDIIEKASIEKIASLKLE